MRTFCDLDLGRIKVVQGQRSWCWYIWWENGWFPIRLRLTPTLYLSPFLKYLTCNFDYLELGQFKVIQGQRSLCQSEVHWWSPVWPPQFPTLYISRHSRSLMWNFCDLDVGQFKVIRGQRSSHVPIGSPLVVYNLASIVPNIVSLTTLKYLMRKLCDLYLGRFKVIQGQRSWCQSITHCLFPIRLLLSRIVVSVTIFQIFDV